MEPIADTVAARAQRAAFLPETGARALLVFNEKAGGVVPADRERLIQAVAAAGVEQSVLVGGDNLARVFARAHEYHVVIVLGGDGTARSAAALAPRDGPPLVLLPGGTLNVLPRALLSELAWPEALAAALARGVVKRLPVGRANGSPFYVAAIFGAPTLLARAREAMREGKTLAAWRRLRSYFRRAFTHKLRARPDRERMRAAEAIGVLCPSFSGGVEAERLEWVRLDAHHLLDLARLGIRALTESWRLDPAIEIGACRTGDIVSLGIIPATLDGEPRTFVSRVRVSFDPRGPLVVALDPTGA